MTIAVGAAPEQQVQRSGTGLGRTSLGLVLLFAGLTISIALSLAIGANALPLSTVLAVLQGGGDTEAQFVVAELRIPRTVVGLVAGAALGVAGALIQAFTRNPLADPGILGVNAGAAFAVALAVAFLGITATTSLVWFAFAGALVVTIVVYVIGSSGRGAADPIRLTLAGVALGAVFAGITTGMTLANPDAFDSMRSWNAGSLLGRGFDVIVPVLPFIAAGLAIAVLVSPSLNSIALGDDIARSQGARIGAVRIGVLSSVTLLAGAATALAGPISFVGLMVPHVIRWLFGVDQRVIVGLSALAAPVIILLSDVLGRVLIAPAEIPVGIVTAFVGAPVLIALARRRKASSLS